MKTHTFGAGRGHLSERAAAVARLNGAWLVNTSDPVGEPCHYFEAPAFGARVDDRTRRAVIRALLDAGYTSSELEHGERGGILRSLAIP